LQRSSVKNKLKEKMKRGTERPSYPKEEKGKKASQMERMCICGNKDIDDADDAELEVTLCSEMNGTR